MTMVLLGFALVRLPGKTVRMVLMVPLVRMVKTVKTALTARMEIPFGHYFAAMGDQSVSLSVIPASSTVCGVHRSAGVQRMQGRGNRDPALASSILKAKLFILGCQITRKI